MIYLRLHQVRNEEIDREQVGARGRNFATVAKFCYNSEIFATIEISLHSEFSLQ